MDLTDGAITLRVPVEAHLPEVSEAIRSSQSELAPFMPWAVGTYDPDDTREWIRRRGYPNEVGFLIIAPGGEVVGACGLNQFSELNRSANLGYWVRTSACGNGYATRATRLLARHGFDHYGLARIEINMSVENGASRRVAERVGARHEGVLRSRLLLNGRHHDAHLFSLLPGDLAPSG
jgi:ribosomal-protein-serine acetyltransferase